MASGKVLDRMRQLYSKVDADVKRWESLQEQAVSLLGTIVNVLSRLPALGDATCYGALAALPGLPRLLLAKQLTALGDLISRLQQQVDEMQAVSDSIERHAAAARRFVRQDRALTPAVCAASAGPVPSVDQCLQGLADISGMYAEEVRLKYALTAQLRLDTTEEDAGQLAAAFAAQPHVDRGRVRDMLHVVAATQEKRHF